MSAPIAPRSPPHRRARPHRIAIPLSIPIAIPIAIAIAVLWPATSQAQTATAPTQTVVITGNPLSAARPALPVSTLSGDELVLRRGATLGETLDGLPGVSSTWFGPNANRPVIRGLDGDRVRVLSNNGASVDASALSYDHALPIDPLILTRVEVLRGPGALLYGGSAIGGVVNALDNRIPRDRLSGTSGTAELRLGGAANERGGAALIESGNDRFALHADVFSRSTDALRVPLHTPIQDGLPLDPAREVRNSAARTSGGAFGGSLFFGPGRIGLSIDSYRSHYGVVAEADVTIDMQRDRVGLAGEWLAPGSAIPALRLNANLTDYRHQEVEGDGTVGTRFASRGHEVRLEMEHARIGPLRGVLGAQLEDSDFSALGEEAFVPGTRTRKLGWFALEQMDWAGGSTSAGVRLERARVGSVGDADPAQPKFGAAQQRQFALRSLSLAHVLPLGPHSTLSANLSANERAPTYFELFADGVHAATGAYERGDPTLAKERGRNLELAWQWKAEPGQLRLAVYSTRFARFIALDTDGSKVDTAGAPVPAGAADSLPLYRFTAVRARLEGVELEAHKLLARSPWTLEATARLDTTRSINLDTGEPLARIAPWRLKLGLDAAQGPWRAGVELAHAARQNRVPASDEPTAGYTLVNLSMSRRLGGGQRDMLWFARLHNAGNRLAYSASSIQTIRGLSPLPGRSLGTGLRIGF